MGGKGAAGKPGKPAKKVSKGSSGATAGRAPAGAKSRSAPPPRPDAPEGEPSPRSAEGKERRRAALLVAARDVFAKRGYARTTVDDIALEAGVARGTFYLYFDDKRDAFEELIDAFGAKITEAIVRIVTDHPSRSVAEQVLENIRAILGVCLGERAMTKILFTDAVGVDPEFQHKLATFYDAVLQLLTESLKDGQALGVVSDGEPRVLAYMTLGALKELLYQAATLGLSAESADALTGQVYAFLRSGYLRVEPAPAHSSRPSARRR